MVLHDVRVLDSVTQIHEDGHTVVVGASHGAEYAGYLAAKLGASGVVLNDAGVGMDDAGIGALPYLADLDIAAATVSHESARIGDGLDCLRRGAISAVNDVAADRGAVVGQSALECARAIHPRRAVTPPDIPDRTQSVTLLEDGDPPVWGFDSLSLVEAAHEGAIAITGSHGERLAGERESYLRTDVKAATFFDAGVGADGAGIGRLDTLEEREIPAGAVDVDSARIGDARSAWETGRLSHVNERAADCGVDPGADLPSFVAAVRRHLE